MGFAIDRHGPPGAVADDPYSKVLPLRRAPGIHAAPPGEPYTRRGSFCASVGANGCAWPAPPVFGLPFRWLRRPPMAETAVPIPGSDQLENTQAARSEQDPSPPSTEHSEDKVAAPRGGRAWKRLRYAGAGIGTLALAVVLSVYVHSRTADRGPDRGWKPDTPLRDSDAVAKPHGKNAPADNMQRSMRLMQYRREAEEALLLAGFYEHEGATDKLRKCLESLTRWRQEVIAIRGEPRFSDADGLVSSRKQDETIAKDFWERVTNAIRRLSQRLDQPAVSGPP
jgi:hypothetical protein